LSDRPANAPAYVDLFSGCGGLSLGFRDAGFQSLIAIDNDPHAVDVYNANLSPPDRPCAIQADVAGLNTHDLVRDFLEARGIQLSKCDVLIGGPPCQSYSLVGRTKIRALMQSDGDLKKYWEEKDRVRTKFFEVYALFLEVLAPRWFLFENVPAIRSHEIYTSLKERFSKLQSPSGSTLQYKVFPEVYLASQYGVPQDRRRFIMVGYRADLDNINWKGPQVSPGVHVEAALSDLPKVSHGHREKRLPYRSDPQNAYQRLMRARLSDADSGFVTHHICRTHSTDDVALFDRMAPGARFADEAVQQALVEINPEHKLLKYATDKFADKLHRLEPSRRAWTVTAHLQKDCYKFIHHSQPRTITVREAARLQSFPDRFSFGRLGLGHAYRLIGNAVPPLLSYAFAESFISADPHLAERAAFSGAGG